MTRAEWESYQARTGLTSERAGKVADLIELIAWEKTGRDIEDWLLMGNYIHARGL